MLFQYCKMRYGINIVFKYLWTKSTRPINNIKKSLYTNAANFGLPYTVFLVDTAYQQHYSQLLKKFNIKNKTLKKVIKIKKNIE